ncbi:MAG: isocitrate lyase/phosphoenolpyruvate mutase family protein [Litoreibacter sp.]|nr:isocitrate lyase/phosphoenolpyruvate mutase family protein [Litoreibacter sp.]MCY4334638.1 isocitrate lyase/phosphoenolpyruvate mutase family protein [Litoreibacter sp.]
MSQAEKATRLANLHQKGRPLVLYNIWDAGGAKAVEKAGAPAVATGSWSMAAAHGYDDGEAIPLDFVLRIVERICASVDVPVTVDFEGGYATDPDEVAENVRKVIRAGAAGVNFEDRVVKGEGLHPIAAQTARIRAIKAVAADEGIPIVLNARTDLFLGTDPARHEGHLSEALEREAAYAKAGADCFFVPGLTDTGLISKVNEIASLPINVMMMGELNSIKQVASLGVSRVSYGPGPFFEFLANVTKACTAIE